DAAAIDDAAAVDPSGPDELSTSAVNCGADGSALEHIREAAAVDRRGEGRALEVVKQTTAVENGAAGRRCTAQEPLQAAAAHYRANGGPAVIDDLLPKAVDNRAHRRADDKLARAAEHAACRTAAMGHRPAGPAA